MNGNSPLGSADSSPPVGDTGLAKMRPNSVVRSRSAQAQNRILKASQT